MKNKLNFIHICDYASSGEGGKLNVLGIFENIFSAKSEYIHPQLYIVTNITTQNFGNLKEVIKIVYEKDNSEIVKPLEFNVSIQPQKIELSKDIKIGFIAQFVGVKFEKFGDYLVQVYFDSEKIGEQRFSFTQLPQPTKLE